MGLRYAPEVQPFVRTLAPEPKRAIRTALRLIAEDPLHPDLDKKLLRKDAQVRFWRARVLKDYRIVYSPRPDHTYAWAIMHRDEGYDWLDRLDPPD